MRLLCWLQLRCSCSDNFSGPQKKTPTSVLKVTKNLKLVVELSIAGHYKMTSYDVILIKILR